MRQDGRVASASLTRRRRRAALIALGGLGVLLVAIAVGGDDDGALGEKASAEKVKLAQLPGGGRRIFPGHQVIAFYGAPQDEDLGALGIGSPTHAGRRLLGQAGAYASGPHKVLPAMELIAEIAQGHPGDDGLYRARQKDAVIRRYLKAARAIKALLILDIQPGQAGFFAEAQYLEKWLKEPDVSLALDPEWHTPGAVPGTVIGSVDVREVNAISYWLEQLVAREKLPQKMLVVHRFTDNGIQGIEQLKPRRDVAVTINVDGFGPNVVKVAKYRSYAVTTPGLYNGFKLFYHEDPKTMKARRVLRIKPRPDLVVYE
jgi:hypothetical protein